MRVLYVLPGVLSQTELGIKELDRRLGILRKYAPSDMEVDISECPGGPTSIESTYDEYIAIPPMLKVIKEAEGQGYDAVIIGCYGDPGLDAARELVDIPVVAPGEVSVHVASMLGHSFSIAAIGDGFNYSYIKQVKDYCLSEKLASIRNTGMSVLEINTNREAAKQKIIDACKKAIDEDGTDVMLLGCMSMAFMDVSFELSEALGVPVINPVIVSLNMAAVLVNSRLSHSAKAYSALKGFPRKH